MSSILKKIIQINQNEILLSLTPAIQEEIQMELRMPNKTTVTKILAQQQNELQNVQIAFQRKATPENRKQDSQFMTLFPGLNLEQIRNNANTITRNSPTTKCCYQQKDLQNKLHQPEKANGESVRRFDV
ncbi:Hypothetical_protein [Hexamita inflata]|uniref:Hypothetical_protein n=1 Tax=Hexamita inflata TaxID=28002 RepID=A0AA86RCF2_9EUKA|nr:Hypothetical protein HINF_LOCUS57504 [Hexamita inflata]